MKTPSAATLALAAAFAASQLAAATYDAAVRPLTSLGTSGRPIATEFKPSGGQTA